MNKDNMLRLQGGYRNYQIPYDIQAIKKNKKDFTTRTGIYQVELENHKPYLEEEDKFKSFNIVNNSQTETAIKYIKELRTLEDQGKMREYDKKVQTIYDIMNSYQEPVQWVIMVNNYLQK